MQQRNDHAAKIHTFSQITGGAIDRHSLVSIIGITFVLYLLSGIGLSTVPLFVSRDLGFGTTAIGIISGAQFLAAIAFRVQAGKFADHHGPKRAVRAGLTSTVIGGALCFLAFLLHPYAHAAIVALVLGRIALGRGESFTMTGMQTWGLEIAGSAHSALVIGWVGTAAFAALAFGAPIGGLVYDASGFSAVGILVVATALVLLLILRKLRSGDGTRSANPPTLRTVLRQMRIPAIAIGLAGFAYGTIITFSVSLFIERAWSPTWAALTVFSVALVGARLLMGSLPDRIGGMKAAKLSLGILVGGLTLIAMTSQIVLGLVGTAVAGLGYAVVFPALCRETVNRVDPASRGTALSLMSASIYLSMGFGNPVLGVMADHLGTGSVFAFSALAAAAAGVVLVLTGRD